MEASPSHPQPSSTPPVDVNMADSSVREESPSMKQSPVNGTAHEVVSSDAEEDPAVASSLAPPAELATQPISTAQSDSSDADMDAEADENFEMDLQPAPTRQEDVDEDMSSSDESIRPAKRKVPTTVEDDDYMRNNPDLYGLRRSGRARPSRPLAESSDEDDSDVPRPRKRLKQSSHPSSKQQTPVLDSATDADSDEYGGRHKKLTKKQKRRFLDTDSAQLSPAHAEVRFSTRRANKISTYNEDEADPFEEDESEMTPNVWANAAEDNSPAIDAILNHRLRADITTPTYAKEEYEFLIKWQNQAYYHATWETIESLQGVRSFRRLENYLRKVLDEDIRITTSNDVLPEEREKYILDREQMTDSLEDYKKVEKVIGHQEGEGGTEYYVKWKSLAYDFATWESADLITDIAQDKIDSYLNRQTESFRSDPSEQNPATRSKFTRLLEQPDYIKGGQLRDFQLVGLNFLAFNWAKHMNVILADEMGLGKTVQTVGFINWLKHARGQNGPFLVAVPLSTMPAWADTFDLWAPDIHYVVYNGNTRARDIIKNYELFPDGNPRHPRFHVLLTTYEFVLADATYLSQIKWQFIAIDEAHRLKNRESQLYDRLREFKVPARLLITGTPVQNNLGELSALFDFICPGAINIDENMDLTEEQASAKIAKLTEDIKPYMLRRTKTKVEKDLPPKTEKIIRVELSDVQLEYYKNILTKNYSALNQGKNSPKQSLLNIMMELKKASNHPFMFPACEERMLGDSPRKEEVLKGIITSSGKMMLLDQLLTKLKRDNHRVLIFSQMVKMLDILSEYMELRGHAFQRLDGTIAAGPRRVAIDHFNAPESADFCFLLSTRAGGLGINLMTADTVIIYDSDWNPQADLQAMARAHRIGQQKPVNVYRLVSKETIEEEILERARNKLMLEFLTIQRPMTDKETQARRNALVGEPGSTSEISRILKKRGQRMFEQTDNQKKLEELDLDAVLEKAEDYKVEQPDGTEADGGEEFLRSFDFVDVKVDEMSWDDIIPKEELEGIRAEEQRKVEEQYLAEVIEQNKPRNVRNRETEDREARQARRIQQRDDADSESESDGGVEKDPARPLNEREHRYLIKGHLKFGSLDDRTEEFLAEARLRNRDLGVVRAAMKEILDTAADLWQAEKDRMAALADTGKTVTKKDKKAVLFEHKGVKRINAETLLERPGEMRLLNEVTKLPDPLSFRIPEATKAAGYSCPWGAREDGMLCVGIAKHGYGSWEKIRDDPDLGLTDKFFLEEHRVDKKAERENQAGQHAKSPGAVHLVRRADYLLSVLKAKYGDDETARKAVENHHRNNKKQRAHDELKAGSSGGKKRDISHQSKRPSGSHHRDNSDRTSTPRMDSRHDGRDERENSSHRDRDRSNRDRHGDRHGGDKHNRNRGGHADHSRANAQHVGGRNDPVPVEEDQIMRLMFKPVRETLKAMKNTTKQYIPEQQARANALRGLLKEVGAFIAENMNDVEEAHNAMEMRFWDHVVMYWPNKGIKGQELASIHRKIVISERVLAGDASPQSETQNETPAERRPNGHYHVSPPQ